MNVEIEKDVWLTARRVTLYKTAPGFRKLIVELQIDSEKGSKAALKRHIEAMIDKMASEIKYRAEFAPRLESRDQIRKVKYYPRYCKPIKKFEATVEIEFKAEPHDGKGARDGGKR